MQHNFSRSARNFQQKRSFKNCWTSPSLLSRWWDILNAITSIWRAVHYVFAVSYAKKLSFKYGVELFYNNCFEKKGSANW